MLGLVLKIKLTMINPFLDLLKCILSRQQSSTDDIPQAARYDDNMELSLLACLFALCVQNNTLYKIINCDLMV